MSNVERAQTDARTINRLACIRSIWCRNYRCRSHKSARSDTIATQSHLPRTIMLKTTLLALLLAAAAAAMPLSGTRDRPYCFMSVSI